MSVGVGFSVAYAPRASNSLWVIGERQPLPSSRGNGRCSVAGSRSVGDTYWIHRMHLPLEDGSAVREVSVGGSHAAILTTTGEGMCV